MKFTWKSAVLLVVLLLAAVMLVLRVGAPKTSAAPATADSRRKAPLPVNVVVLAPAPLENKLLATGTLLAFDEVELRSEISGRVTGIYFSEGAKVKSGTLLVKMYDADLQAQLTRALSNKKLAEQNEYRQRVLLEKQGTSRELYDAALNQVNILAAEIDLIKAQIAKTEIRAPFDGSLGLKYISDGAYLTPASKIALLQNVNRVKLDFSVPEKYSSDVGPGRKVEFTVQGSPRVFTASVYAIEPKIDPATRTMLLRAVAANPSGALHPGAFAEVVMPLKQIAGALLLPTESITQDFEGSKVFLFKNGIAVAKSVQLGIRGPKTIQVTNGVSAGDTLITTGILQLKSGMPVRIARK